jgi:hypothetical protein
MVGSTCPANKVLVGWAATSCGKGCSSASGVCCDIRLAK